MLALQQLSRLGAQGAIVRKGEGGPPLVAWRGIETVIGEAWEIQYRGGGGREEDEGWDSIIGGNRTLHSNVMRQCLLSDLHGCTMQEDRW